MYVNNIDNFWKHLDKWFLTKQKTLREYGQQIKI